MKTLFKPFLILFLLVYSFSAFSQTGAIQGNITDTNGEPLMDVNVEIPAIKKGGITDWEGNFYIPNVTPGTYDIYINLIGYKADTVKGFTVPAGGPVTLTRQLKSEGDVIDLDIAVIGTKVTGSDEAVLQVQKESEEVVSVVSSEQIAKSQDRDAAQVIRRIPGVTLINNRFIMVRGLSQRYNTVMLNGAIAPSTDPGTRSFSFDILPSSLLDRILVYKSGSAELPGDFAGAVIKVYTKGAVDENSVAIGITGGYRFGTTFGGFRATEGSSTDFLGFDNGKRALPSGFPKNINNLGFNYAQVAEESRKFDNDWTINDKTALPDLRLNFLITRAFNINSIRVNHVSSINYSNVREAYDIERWRYESYREDNTSILRFNYNDNFYSTNIRAGILHNWSFVFGPRTKIDFKNFYTRLASNETIIREGIDYDVSNEVRNYSLRYFSRGIYSGQLVGNHEFKNEKSKYEWVAGLSHVSRNEPNWRRARTQRPLGSKQDFVVTIPPSANLFDAARFYSYLNERTVMNSGEFSHLLLGKKDTTNLAIKLGYYAEHKDRDYSARWMAYTKASANAFNDSIAALPIDQIFADANIAVPNGFILTEGTNLTDQYYATNLLLAGYGSASANLGNKVNISSGLRYEYNYLRLQIVEDGADTVDNPIPSFLPFVNVSYNFTKKMLVRAAYSKTINRQEFRELAPFGFYDFDFNVDIIGNPSLVHSDIHNADLRWEYYPTQSEAISFGLFYKYFINPIELLLNQGASLPIFTYGNAESATSYGAEVEIRKSLYNLSSTRFIQNLSLLINASVIQSTVNLSEAVTEGRFDAERPLQGQSPYVVNTGLYYNDDSLGINVSLLYNVYGKRIFSVGDNETRTIYEMPRHLLDLSISKNISENFQIKFGITDILNQALKLYEDADFDGEIDRNGNVDKPILSVRRGQYATLGISYKF